MIQQSIIAASTISMETDKQTPTFLFGTTSLPGYHLASVYRGQIKSYCTSRTRREIPKDWHRLDLSITDDLTTLFETTHGTLLYTDAVCDVEKCERFPDWATEINVNNLKRTLEFLPPQWRLVYLSSDHVFGGDGQYSETSLLCPISHYGRTRAASEALLSGRENTLIIRAGLGVGSSFDGKTGHLDWLRYRLENGLPVTIISDEVRSVIPISSMVERIWALARSETVGIRHLAASGPTTRPQLALDIINRLSLNNTITMVSRFERPYPHLGHVELITDHVDALADQLDVFRAISLPVKSLGI